MKRHCLLALLVCLACASIHAQDFEVVRLGVGHSMAWSPNGKYLSYVDNQGLALWVADSGYTRHIASPQTLANLRDYGYASEWTADNELLYVRKERLDGAEVTDTWDAWFIVISPEGTFTVVDTAVYHPQGPVPGRSFAFLENAVHVNRCEYPTLERVQLLSGVMPFDTGAYYAENRKAAPGNAQRNPRLAEDIWLVRPDGNTYKQVTSDINWRAPVLSPDHKLILCNDGGAVLDLDGNKVGTFERVSFGSWLPDSRRIIFSRAYQDESGAIANDLFVADVTGEHEIKLTNTPDVTELEPQTSPDLTMVTYRSRSQKGIFVEVLKIGELLR